jgi:ABC-2 type transport system permease protein
MLRSLVKIRLAMIFGAAVRISKGKKKRGPLTKALIALLALYVVGAFMLQFGMLFSGFCAPMHSAGYDMLYFALAGVIAFALIIIGSVFMTHSQLFEARDNELLLSMPIPPAVILTSRMLTLLAMDYLIEALVLIPAAVVYGITAAFSVSGIIIFAAASLLLPFPALALSCLVGWLIAVISRKFRAKSLIVTSLSVISLLLYFYFYIKINGYISYLVANGSAVTEAIHKAFLPAYLYGMAISHGDMASLMQFFLFAAVPFLAVCLALSRAFIQIATNRTGIAKAGYRRRPLRVRGARSALVRKELRHFFSNPMYILNGAMGVLFTFILPIGILVKRDLFAVVIAEIPGLDRHIGPVIVLVLCGLTSTSIISAPSISLEGKNLWIAQSLPVDGSDVLLAKAYAHMIICMPAILFAAAVLDIMLAISPAMKAFVFIAPLLLTMAEALYGVAINLRFPRFDWISETEAIKQGASTLIAIFSAIGMIAGAALLYTQALSGSISAELYILLLCVLLAAVSLFLFKYLKGKGRVVFAALGS